VPKVLLPDILTEINVRCDVTGAVWAIPKWGSADMSRSAE